MEAISTTTEGYQQFRCYLIGRDNLAQKCAELLLKAGYELLGIISGDALLQKWAADHSISCFPNTQMWTSSGVDDFDYLFSVINQAVLTPDVLRLPRRLAINYHDSPLPRYAGVHATSWAILGGEKSHAITWHVMSEGIDTGDILKQVTLPITTDETALTLNMKCYEAALASFEELLKEFKNNTLTLTPQDLTHRSYFGYSKKPVGVGILNGLDTAENIDRVYRALRFGHHPNTLATPKLFINGRCFVVSDLKITKAGARRTPGEIVQLTEDSLRIATATDDIEILGLSFLNGKTCTFNQLKSLCSLNVGDRLSVPDSPDLEALTQKVSRLFVHEPFWQSTWQQAQPVHLPYLSHPHEKATLSYQKKYSLTALSTLKNSEKPVPFELAVLTLFAMYFYRLTGFNVLTLGYTDVNLQKTAQETGALFVKSVPMNFDVNPNDTLAHLLEESQKLLTQTQQHATHLKDLRQRYAALLESIPQEDYALPCTFYLDGSKQKEGAAPEKAVEDQCGLVIKVFPEENAYELKLRMSSNEDFSGKDLLDRIDGHIKTLLQDAIKNPSKSMVQLNLLTAAEEKELLDVPVWPDETPLKKTIVAFFEEQVEKAPKAPAVLFQGKTLSYRALNKKANQVAHYLMEKGVQPQSPVAIFFPRSTNAIISILGILKADAVYVPIDPSYPASRVRLLLEDCGAHWLLTDKENEKKAEASVLDANQLLHVINVENKKVEKQPVSAPKKHLTATPEDLAYILYTSGSTGKPKGVEALHRGVTRLVKSQNYITLRPEDKVVQLSNLIFDGSSFEIWGALLNGALLHVVDKETALNPHQFSKELRDACTVVFITPAMFNGIFKVVPDAFDQVRFIAIGGEPVYPTIIAPLLERAKSRKLPMQIFNVYGPTENTAFSTYYPIHELKSSVTSIPIGKGIAYTDTYVLDDHYNLLPRGVPGELYLGGTGLASGYLNQPELTEKVFVSLPFLQDPGEKFYRTGDIVRPLLDGNLVFVRRKDEQIKIRGIRVEVGEIESWIASYPAVHEVVVLFNTGELGRKKLLAYIVSKTNQTVSIKALQKFISKHLPAHMMPANFIILDAFPLTMNKKIDKARLLDPDLTIQSSQDLPEGEKEIFLANIWKEVLHLDFVGRDTDFFALGGDSIVAMQIVNKVQQKNFSIRSSDVFQHSTIKQLAKVIKPTKLEKETFEKTKLRGSFSLTPIQHWFVEGKYQSLNQFSQRVVLRVSKPLDLSNLESAFEALIRQHEALRISLRRFLGKWHQSVLTKNSRFSLTQLTLDEKNIVSCINEAVNTLHVDLNLRKPPLIKAAVLSSEDASSFYLVILIHHFVVDGVSWRIILEDLFKAYDAISQGDKPVFPKKTLSFKSWSKKLCQYAKSPEVMDQRAYWLGMKAPRFSLPVDFEHMANLQRDAETFVTSFDFSVEKVLSDIFGKNNKIRCIELLISALVHTLSQWTQQKSVYFHLEGHGREPIGNGLDVSRTLGWFTTLYPFVATLDSLTASPLEVLKFVRTYLKVLPQKGLGYGLLRYLGKKSDVKRLKANEDPKIAFNYLGNFDQGFKDTSISFAGQPVLFVSSPLNKRRHLLEITAWISEDRLYMHWDYNKRFHQEKTIQNLADTYSDLLSQLVRCCQNTDAAGCIPSDFPLASVNADQLDRLLLKYPDTEDMAALSPIQSGFLFYNLYDDENSIYMTQISWLDDSGLNLSSFRAAWEKIVERHAIFRTRFLWEHLDEPLQIVHKEASLPWEEHDFSSLSSSDASRNLFQLMSNESSKGFDLSIMPAMRVVVVKQRGGRCCIIWTHHHILLGGWSVSLVVGELYRIYRAMLEGVKVDLPNAPSYQSYLTYLSENKKHNSSETFWREYLKDLPPLLSLSFKKTPRASSFHLQQLSCTFSKEFSDQLKKFCIAHHASLSELMLLGWLYLIKRYTQGEDVLTGVVVSTRSSDFPGLDNVAGPFLNTLPFRLKIKEKMNVLSHLSEIRKATMGVIEHSQASLLDIYGWLGRNTQSTLFETVFAFENYPFDIVDLNLKNFNLKDINHYPLTLAVFPYEKTRVVFTYDRKRFGDDFMKRLMLHYQNVLENFVEKYEEEMLCINFLSEEERHCLLTGWNNSDAAYPNETLSGLFALAVKKDPNRAAIVCGSRKITYRELEVLSSQWAWYLKNNGVERGERVGVYIGRSVEMIVALLSILKAGAAYVPIDLRYPRKSIHYILNDAAISYLFCSTESALRLEKFLGKEVSHLKLITLDRKDEILKVPTYPPTLESDAEDLAYVIYTSGTTGKPKGVLIRHKSVVNLVTSVLKRLEASNDETLLSISSISFDVSVFEIFGSLLWGMTLIVAQEEEIRDPVALRDLILNACPTIMPATPATWHMLLSGGWNEGNGMKLLSAGETLDVSLAEELLKTGASVWNLYGPTETTIYSTMTQVQSYSHITIGKPLANNKLYVLDQYQRFLPVDVPGEIYIGGEGLAKGYLNRPELTKQRFLKNPFDKKKGSCLYQTGDLGVWLSSGELEHIDRLDNQVKVRGFRIELEGIKHCLLKNPMVRDCAVVKIGRGVEDETLVLFYIPFPKASITVSQIRDFLSNELPQFLLPDDFVLLSEMPLTANGKADLKALKTFYLETKTALKSQTSQLSDVPVEQLLINLFRKVLNREDVFSEDSFFDMGGHSILAIRLLSEINDCFSLNLRIKHIMLSQTPRALSQLINTHTPDVPHLKEVPSPVVCLQPKGNGTPLFLIHPVGGSIFWFLSMVKHFGEARPLYGIQDPGLDSGKAFFLSFEAMASFYVTEIRKVQKEGPYFLGGASFGATMAVEVAKQLQAFGEKIQFVALLDGWAFYPEVVETREFLEKQMNGHYEKMKAELAEYCDDRINVMVDLHWQRAHLLRAYSVSSIDFPLTLFKPAETIDVLKPIDSSDNHWGKYCSNLDVIRVLGDHETMFYEPQVKILAKLLVTKLIEIEASSSSDHLVEEGVEIAT